MGLKLKLRPYERFIVNGAVIENGGQRNTVTVANTAQVMTARNIMQLAEATTPAKRTYFAIQAMLVDPRNADDHRASYRVLLAQLMAAIHDPGMRTQLSEAADWMAAGDYYKALMALRPVIAYETGLLGPDRSANGPHPQAFPSQALEAADDGRAHCH